MNHSNTLHGIRFAYWRAEGGNYIASDKENATRVVIAPVGKHYPEFQFLLPEEKDQAEKMVYFLEAAAKSGDYRAREEIRKALGL
jgi:hypothetical protein